MELIEKPNLRAVHYLNSIEYDAFKKDCIEDAAKNGEKKPTEKDMKTWYNVLKQFCKTNIKTKGITKRIYSYSLNTPAGAAGGRLFSGGSMQGIWGVYRGLLMRALGTDIDMSNAHPVILRYVCRLHNIDCPQLEYLIKNRSECFAKFQSEKGIAKDAAKKLYLVATNNDKYTRNSAMKTDHFKAYEKEMKEIQKQLILKTEYRELFETIPEYKLQKNYNGAAINRILCYYENQILQHAIHIVNQRGIEIAILMFDGLMVYGDYYEDATLLKEITDYVESQLPGLNMVWAYKEHDETLQIPDDFDETNYNTNCETPNGVESDLEAAKVILKLYPHWVCCMGLLFVFDNTTGMWSSDETIHFKILAQFDKNLRVLKTTKDGDAVPTARGYGNNTTLMRQLIPQLKAQTTNNNWLRDTAQSSLGKLLFNNGYYDLRKGEFHSEYDPDIVFMYKIHHNYEVFDDEDIEYMNDIKNRLFIEPLGEDVADYFILNLARGIAGDVMKRMIFGLGGTDCGKSVLTDAVKSAFGEYVGSFNAECLAYNSSSADEAAQMRWVMLLCFKRIIFSNEIKSTVELNGNMIKKISSGGDTLIARNHGEAEHEFSPHFLPIGMANDLPNIKPYDDAVSNRVRIVSYTRRFVDEPTNEFELRKDPNITTEIKSAEFQRVFVGMLILRYLDFNKQGRVEVEPVAVMNAKRDWIGDDESMSLIGRFNMEFQITNNIDDYVVSDDIQRWITVSKLGITMKKFGIEIKKYCKLKHYDNVVNKLKKVYGRPLQAWVGIKKIEEDYAEAGGSTVDDDDTDIVN